MIEYFNCGTRSQKNNTIVVLFGEITKNREDLILIIKYVIVKQNTKVELYDVTVMRGITSGLDHRAVREKLTA